MQGEKEGKKEPMSEEKVSYEQRMLAARIGASIDALNNFIASLKDVVTSCVDCEHITDAHRLINTIELAQKQRELLSELRDEAIPVALESEDE